MTYRLIATLQVVNERGQVVNSRGFAVNPGEVVGGLESTQPIQDFESAEPARERLNHVWSLLRELSTAFNNRPARS